MVGIQGDVVEAGQPRTGVADLSCQVSTLVEEHTTLAQPVKFGAFPGCEWCAERFRVDDHAFRPAAGVVEDRRCSGQACRNPPVRVDAVGGTEAGDDLCPQRLLTPFDAHERADGQRRQRRGIGGQPHEQFGVEDGGLVTAGLRVEAEVKRVERGGGVQRRPANVGDLLEVGDDGRAYRVGDVVDVA